MYGLLLLTQIVFLLPFLTPNKSAFVNNNLLNIHQIHICAFYAFLWL